MEVGPALILPSSISPGSAAPARKRRMERRQAHAPFAKVRPAPYQRGSVELAPRRRSTPSFWGQGNTARRVARHRVSPGGGALPRRLFDIVNNFFSARLALGDAARTPHRYHPNSAFLLAHGLPPHRTGSAPARRPPRRNHRCRRQHCGRGRDGCGPDRAGCGARRHRRRHGLSLFPVQDRAGRCLGRRGRRARGRGDPAGCSSRAGTAVGAGRRDRGLCGACHARAASCLCGCCPSRASREGDAPGLRFRTALVAEFARRIDAAIDSGHLPRQDAERAAAALVGALIEGLLGPLAPRGAAPRDDVQALALFALRALGVVDARARGLVVQAEWPVEKGRQMTYDK